MAAALTFRERIMRHLEARYKAQAKPAANIEWDIVTRKPLTKEQQMLGFALGLYDTSERVQQNIGHDLRLLNVVAEFHCLMHDGEDAEITLNRVLGEVQRVAGLDIQLGEPDPNNPTGPSYKLALDMNEKGNEIDPGGQNPRGVSGVVVFEIKYRTKSNNPFAR